MDPDSHPSLAWGAFTARGRVALVAEQEEEVRLPPEARRRRGQKCCRSPRFAQNRPHKPFGPSDFENVAPRGAKSAAVRPRSPSRPSPPVGRPRPRPLLAPLVVLHGCPGRGPGSCGSPIRPKSTSSPPRPFGPSWFFLCFACGKRKRVAVRPSPAFASSPIRPVSPAQRGNSLRWRSGVARGGVNRTAFDPTDRLRPKSGSSPRPFDPSVSPIPFASPRSCLSRVSPYSTPHTS